ncbi:MAG: hypothetical protein U1E39_10645 [Planctomycetota bacterium]
MGRRSSGCVAAAAAAVLGAVLAAPRVAGDPAPAPAKDWLVAHLEREASTSGRIGWDAFAPGSWVERSTDPARTPGPATATVEATRVRETLEVRAPDRTVVRTQFRLARDRRWPEGSATPVPRVAAAPGQVKEEIRAHADVVRDGQVVPCTERALRWIVDGTLARQRVLYADAAGRLVRWTQDDRDGWTVTYDVLRDDVAFPLGDRVLTCREVRKTATAAAMNVDLASTELWCPDVPDFVVRSETVSASGPQGARTTTPAQVVVLVALETRPAEPAEAPTPAPATAPTAPPAPAPTPAPAPQPAK